MPTLYIFVGPPGSGKTTVANFICQTGAVHIWADRERSHMFGDPTHSEAESLQLYDYLNRKTAKLLEQGKDVVFDTNFNFHKDREHLRQIAEQAGARLQIIRMTTDRALARKRAMEGTHAERNGMPYAMSEATFDRIVHNLEPLQTGETAVDINGVDLTAEKVQRALSLT